MTALFATPPGLERYRNFDRYMRRCRHGVDENARHNELFFGMISESSIAMVNPRLFMLRDPVFAAAFDKAIGVLFDDEDASRPLHVIEALALCQTSDDRRAAFADLLRTPPVSILEARGQVAYVLAACEDMGEPLTLDQAMTLLRSIATPPPAARHGEVTAIADKL
jgi:hypothetical protein